MDSQNVLKDLTSPTSVPILNDQLRQTLGRLSQSENAIDTLNALFTGNVLQVQYGGTGKSTANDALNALLPDQTGNANKFLKTDGTNTSWATVLSDYIAGDYMIAGPTKVVHGGTETTYTKIGQVYVSNKGVLRIKFLLNWTSGSGGSSAYGRIYRNGVAVGTERTVSSSGMQEFSEDISGWSVGDLCQLYAKRDTFATNYDCGGMRVFVGNPISDVNTDVPSLRWFGSGLPNSGLGSQGDLYTRNDGSTSTTLYVKTDAATWTAK